MTMTASAPLAAEPRARPGNLEIRNVSKAFPNVQALTDVSLDIRPGEILAFMGENGAGKSTLLKIINGDYQPDAGTLTLDGRRLSFPNPRVAHAAGVRVIYQEPEIVPGIDVAENIWVGELPRRFGFLDRRQLYAQVQDSLKEYGFEGVLSIRSRPIVRRIDTPGPITFGRGLELTVSCDEAAFEGSGVILLGAVLDQFFARYVSINSFTETVIKTTHRGEIMRWPARIGKRPTV